jgi:hypothetical protein
MTALDRVAAILAQARVAGGWSDEDVAATVLDALGIDEDDEPVDPAPTSPNLGHG